MPTSSPQLAGRILAELQASGLETALLHQDASQVGRDASPFARMTDIDVVTPLSPSEFGRILASVCRQGPFVPILTWRHDTDGMAIVFATQDLKAFAQIDFMFAGGQGRYAVSASALWERTKRAAAAEPTSNGVPSVSPVDRLIYTVTKRLIKRQIDGALLARRKLRRMDPVVVRQAVEALITRTRHRNMVRRFIVSGAARPPLGSPIRWCRRTLKKVQDVLYLPLRRVFVLEDSVPDSVLEQIRSRLQQGIKTVVVPDGPRAWFSLTRHPVAITRMVSRVGTVLCRASFLRFMLHGNLVTSKSSEVDEIASCLSTVMSRRVMRTDFGIEVH